MSLCTYRLFLVAFMYSYDVLVCAREEGSVCWCYIGENFASDTV